MHRPVDSPHIRREVRGAGISCHHVTFEDLFTHVLEAVEDVEDGDVVVHRLTSQPLA